MKKADASPTKDFFVRMITRDISLEDCILDLIDNCLDGSRRKIVANGNSDLVVNNYDGFRAAITFDRNEFRIEDNCGGISVDNAIDYAFHFGRRADAPAEADLSIGLYGIGMKRAILKIGNDIEIHSSTESEAFRCKIDVDDWLKRPQDWEFDLDDAQTIDGTGTVIRIRKINKGVAEEFGDKAFANGLARIVARDYALFLQKGFKVLINGQAVKGYDYSVRESDEFKPYRKDYQDEGVRVSILAGMAAPPPDDLQPTERSETEYFGWYVLCNDRVVLAANKTEATVWGDENFQRWHFQYNGFVGMVLFSSNDAGLLPWTTTKREIDESSPLYRRAVNEMKIATRPWIEYTNQRKADLEEARAKEKAARPVSFFEVEASPSFKVPQTPQRPKVKYANIQYRRLLSEVREAASALGNKNMSYRTVGEKTFEYFIENEVEE